jgi:cation diffusion facilitator CzcD-associated flavoprotein CzcO
MNNCEVAVIGAGPYGLSTTAHLRARSIDSIMFGEPMAFWDKQMPDGMLLRSPWAASHLSDPGGELTLDIIGLRNKHFPRLCLAENLLVMGDGFRQKLHPTLTYGL